MKRIVTAACMVVFLLVLLGALAPQSQFVSANSGTSAETLLKLEAEFMKATADRGADGYISYYAEDAVELPNGEVILEGKEKIRPTLEFLNQGTSLTWTPVRADMAASGDLGYTYGNYEFRGKDKDGKAIVQHGKYTSIWKKQKDGSWKVVLDMGNSSPEPGVHA